MKVLRTLFACCVSALLVVVGCGPFGDAGTREVKIAIPWGDGPNGLHTRAVPSNITRITVKITGPDFAPLERTVERSTGAQPVATPTPTPTPAPTSAPTATPTASPTPTPGPPAGTASLRSRQLASPQPGGALPASPGVFDANSSVVVLTFQVPVGTNRLLEATAFDSSGRSLLGAKVLFDVSAGGPLPDLEVNMTSVSPSPSPTPGPVVTSPTSLVFRRIGASQSFTVTQSNTAGIFTTSANCISSDGTTVATVSPTSGPGPFTVTSAATGNCTITVAGQGGLTATVSVQVNTTAVTIQ